tara:strand:+ start:468 stop:728 length:261 start_codon:yes stop_codon:yes gene_type:complete
MDLQKIVAKLEKNHKDLVTKYRVLVKRTDSIISSLQSIEPKVDLLLDKLSAFEILDEELEEQEGWNPYETEAEEYENYDDDNPETD